MTIEKTIIVCLAIISITFLMCWALEHGHDGLLLTGCVAIIAGLAGLVLPTPDKLKI